MAEINDGKVASTRNGAPPRGIRARTLPVMAMALSALLATVGYASLTGSADAVLASRYGRALGDAETHWGSAPTANLWMSRLGDQPAVLHRAVAIGDRITVGGQARTDVFEVVGLERIDGDVLGQPSLHLQVVTARPDGNGPAETVRFLFAVEAPATAPATLLPEKVL